MSIRASERILAGSREIWEEFHNHPFVKGIADGTLPKEKFEYFMIQDYLYLMEYAKVFSIGAAKAKEPDVMKAFYTYVNQIMNGELNIHRAYMERLGISIERAENTEMALDNVSYTSYMLRAAWEGGPAEVCAAILPCAVSYEEIACRMVEENPSCAEHAFYGEWIRGYADMGYHEENAVLMELTDKAAEGYSESAMQELILIGQRCSRYEGRFWDMSWELRR